MENFYLLDECGSVHSFDILMGVNIAFYSLHMEHQTEEKLRKKLPEKLMPRQWNIMEINYCCQGRYECEFMPNSWFYLSEGEIALSRGQERKKASRFPLGDYKGICIMIDLDRGDEELFPLMTQFGVDGELLAQKWKEILPCIVLKQSESGRDVFEKLYEQEEHMTPGYLKCKLVELLLLFCQCEMEPFSIHWHYSRTQVEKVRHIREHLEEELDRELTLAELALEHEISESTLKRCFAAIYGISPSQYRKEFRMQAAAKLLTGTKGTVAEIGMQVGYMNSSKFSSAFRSIMDMSPSEYRNQRSSE